MKTFHVATGRDIGKRCREWAQRNVPPGWRYTDNAEEADVYISVLSPFILKRDFIATKKRCFNFHPGLLPDYRGSGISSWVIINEEEYTGSTLHIIDEGIDTGAIIDMKLVRLYDNDTAEFVFQRTEDAIYEQFQEWLRPLLDEAFVAFPQPKEGHTYYRKDLEKARNLTKFKRAFTFKGKPGAVCEDNDGYLKEI